MGVSFGSCSAAFAACTGEKNTTTTIAKEVDEVGKVGKVVLPGDEKGKAVLPGDQQEPGLIHRMSDIRSFQKILKKPFSFGDYLKRSMFTGSSSRILVVGMGGGCDIFMAYAIHLKLNMEFGREYDIMYANTKAAKFLKTDLGGHEKITDCLYKVPPELIVLEKGSDKSCYGTSRLTQSVPRHQNGSPFLFVHPSSSKDLTIATRENEKGIKEAFRSLKPDLIIGVDTGGDCITGGMDWEGSIELGRDVQMQNAIVQSGIPHIIVAVGPGSDGESPVQTMNEVVTRLEKQGCFLGAFKLDEYLPKVRMYTKNLNPTRTPNICYSALMGQTPEKNGSKVVEGVEYLKLVRHCATRWIPRNWLSHALAFDLSARNQSASI